MTFVLAGLSAIGILLFMILKCVQSKQSRRNRRRRLHRVFSYNKFKTKLNF